MEEQGGENEKEKPTLDLPYHVSFSQSSLEHAMTFT